MLYLVCVVLFFLAALYIGKEWLVSLRIHKERTMLSTGLYLLSEAQREATGLKKQIGLLVLMELARKNRHYLQFVDRLVSEACYPSEKLCLLNITEIYRNHLQVYPKDVCARYHLGLALHQLGDTQEARREWEQVITLGEPGSGWVYRAKEMLTQ